MNTDKGADKAAVVFHPPIMLAVFFASAFVARRFLPFGFLSESLTTPAGPVIVVASLALFCWAVVTMRRGGASVPTHTATEQIVVSGPYRFSRNPIYLAMLVLQLGVGVWMNSLWFIAFALLSIGLLNWGVISREEHYLEQKFGQQYIGYKQRVRRWL